VSGELAGASLFIYPVHRGKTYYLETVKNQQQWKLSPLAVSAWSVKQKKGEKISLSTSRLHDSSHPRRKFFLIKRERDRNSVRRPSLLRGDIFFLRELQSCCWPILENWKRKFQRYISLSSAVSWATQTVALLEWGYKKLYL